MNLQEAGTFQAQRQGEQWFRKLPSDNRFVKVTDVRFDPQTTLNGATKIKFVLPAQTEGSVYLMHQHFLSVKLRMVQSDGTAIKNIGAGTMKDPKRMPLIAPVKKYLINVIYYYYKLFRLITYCIHFLRGLACIWGKAL